MADILVINGSYRDNGITDQIVEIMAECLRRSGTNVETICLREYPIEFCRNCRKCTQLPGNTPGECVIRDGMRELVEKIETSDGYILAAPTNVGSVTAVFKRFMERLVVYAYWPWEMKAPQYRKKAAPKKKAVLVSSCAAPGFLGHRLFATHKQLKITAQIIGAANVGSLFAGMIAGAPRPHLSKRIKRKAYILAEKLL